MGSCLRWRSLSVFGSCLQVKDECDRRSASDLMQYLQWCELYRQEIFDPTLTSGPQLSVVIKKKEILIRMAGLFLKDVLRCSVIRERLGVKSLLLLIERNHVRWLGSG